MTDHVNPDAILYDSHRVGYPQHLRRRLWVRAARLGRVVIRDDPDGHPPCRYGHERCRGDQA